MSDTMIQRYLAAAAQVPAGEAPLVPLTVIAQPSIFDRSTYIVLEIGEVITKACIEIIKLRTGRTSGSLEDMRQACAELSKLFGQGQQMADALGRVMEAEGKSNGQR